MKPILTIFVSVILSTFGAYILVAYVPLSFFPDVVKHLYGTTVTTINGSDTISGSRTTINTNFTNLNTGKLEASSYFSTTTHANIASLPGLTAAAALATVGTITSGTWTGTAVGVTYGGTGTTSPTSNLVMLGNAASGLKTVNGTGNSGQFLQSNGAGVAPSWTSAGTDVTQNYAWTGIHSFNNAASTTIAFGLYAGSIASRYFIATSTTATSTFAGGVTMLNGTTTNFEVGGVCINCLSNYHQIAKGGAGPTGVDAAASISVACDTGRIVTCMASSTTNVTKPYLMAAYYDVPNNQCTATYGCTSTGCAANTISAIAMCATF